MTGADVSGDTGWISGNYTVVDGSGAAVDSGSYLSVHKRTNGQWLYIRDIVELGSRAGPAPARSRRVEGRSKGRVRQLTVFLRAARIACTSDSGTSAGTGSSAHDFASSTVFS